tara:strand:+ start:30882 stop:31472 length:591 start_codon:yes stop_codon:yes gene_type:complete
MKTKKGEKEKLRRIILDKTISYLKRHGNGGTGTDEIMRQMGLTRGALYSHFKSKDDLFAAAVSHDLQKLEESLSYRFAHDGPSALARIIKDHLSEKSLTDIEGGCAFTSLSSDMQRGKAAHRNLYESHMNRIYESFAEALRHQFPDDSKEIRYQKALNLYSGLVGTLTMARTMKDKTKAMQILESGREFLLRSFTR